MQSVQDDWEQKFALTDSLRAGLAELQDACSEYHTQLLLSQAAPIEPTFQHSHASPLLSARRNASLRNLSTLRAMSPVPRRPSSALPEAIETTAQFLEWYGRVESRLAAEQDAESHAYAERLRLRKRQCGRMAQEAESIEKALQQIQKELERVSERSSGVQAACSEQQARGARLKRMSREISEQLAVYQSLGPIAQLLSAPGDKVCLDPEFLPSLQRIEEAAAFITAHAGARDSELYLMRFAQCRTRGLTLIKMHAQREFRRLGAQLKARSSDVHVRFRTAAVQLRPLLEALQRGQQGAGAMQVLGDVQQAYFAVRMSWLRTHIPRSLQAIEREHEDEAGMLRDWCAFMMNVCADEGRLYLEMFGREAQLLREHEDQAMALFHEQVRPRIIRLADVESLATLSLTLLTYQRPSASEDAQLDAFYAAVAAVLQDAQQRLAFRAQAFVQSEIARYRLAREEALGILESLRASRGPCEYAPVGRLRWLVAQIGGCLDGQVQQGIAHEALAACKQNIVAQGARALRDSARGDPDAERLAHVFVAATQNSAEQVISDLD
ncbi:Golgi transport complex subunit 3 [Coemansia sp. RSA 990]|nr:Golgi transport complex subunit 3 [Coemansia sp. RSA 990]